VPEPISLQRLIEEAAVPGVAAALVEEGELRHTVCCGLRSARSADRIDEHTVFDAASLTKPVFAHAVLQLSDEGHLSLDAPLSEYLPDYMLRDQRASTITARHVLSHTSGFPNWRSADFPLKTYFEPGEQFSYSGEGYLYLQKTIEAVIGRKLHTLVEELVFRPLGMSRSSLIWDFRFDENRAYPHDAFGRPALGYKPGEANAAWSLQTTVSDFARFLVAVLDGERLGMESAALWPRPHIEVDHAGIQLLAANNEPRATGVAWGLGWGLETEPGTFFQWGDNGTFNSFAIGSMTEHRAVVVFTNGASGLSIMPELLSAFIAGPRPSLVWLDYVRHDAPVRRLMREARQRGIEAVWPQMESARLDPAELGWIAQGLGAAGHEEAATWLRERLNRLGVNK
jgi:CubicO group peptidase (beta-lactamase class C family)